MNSINILRRMPNNSKSIQEKYAKQFQFREVPTRQKKVGRTIDSQGHGVLIHRTFACDFVSKGTVLCEQIEALPRV